jgi:thioredoxin reductase (NADPH)
MIALGATRENFDDLIGIHPTCAEGFTTLAITKSSGTDPAATGC